AARRGPWHGRHGDRGPVAPRRRAAGLVRGTRGGSVRRATAACIGHLRKDVAVLRTPVKMVTAALAAGAVLTACGGQVKLGAAALVGPARNSAATLSPPGADPNQGRPKDN